MWKYVYIGKDINKHSLKTVIDGIRSYYVPWFVCEAVPSMWWVKRCCIHFWCMDLLCQFSQGFSSLVMLWMERSLLHPKICGLLAPVVTLGFRDTKHVLHENEFKAVWRLQFSVESIDFLNEMWLYRVHFSFESVVRLKMLSSKFKRTEEKSKKILRRIKPLWLFNKEGQFRKSQWSLIDKIGCF